MRDVLGRRAIAAIIDAAAILVLLVVVAKTLGDEGATKRSIWAETQGSPRAVFLVLTFAYFFVTELVWAQTLGKRIMNLRVVGVDGARPGGGAMFVRNLVRVIDWLPALYVAGAVTVYMTGDRRQRLGDLAARTQVVPIRDDDGPPDEEEPPTPPSDEEVLASVLR